MSAIMKLRLSSFDRPSNRFTWKVRIIVNSQPYPEITTDLKFFPSRDISTFIEQRNSDIEMFIWKKIRDLSLQKGYYCRLKIETPNILKVNVGGSFLGIGLMCDEMKKLDIQNAPAFPENVAPGPFLHQLDCARLSETQAPRKDVEWLKTQNGCCLLRK